MFVSSRGRSYSSMGSIIDYAASGHYWAGMMDAAIDDLAVVVYALTLYMNDMAWVLTGFNLSIRSVYDKVDIVTIMVSAFQISDTCDNMRVQLNGASAYIVCAFMICVSIMSRTEAFMQRSSQEKRACVCIMITVALTTRGDHVHRWIFNTTRICLYMLICRLTNQNTSSWDIQARASWCLSAYTWPLLFIALLQLSLDADSYVITVKKQAPKEKKVIETWDVNSV